MGRCPEELFFKEIKGKKSTSRRAFDEPHIPTFRIYRDGNRGSHWRGFKALYMFRKMQVQKGWISPVAKDSETHQDQEANRKNLKKASLAAETP